uniref:Uncharacterized protein n=1 Tax=Nothobranchius furzeri TaxID=105023 RepID=A0A8C6QAF1_NOTFU
LSLQLMDQPNNSLVFAASCLSTSAAISSDISFFTWLMALERTLLRDSLALLPNCLASLARFSRCSRVTLQKEKGGHFNLKQKTTRRKRTILHVRYYALLMLIIMIATTMLRVNSSLSPARTDVISSFTSSRLMMSSTRAELIFTFADWPFTGPVSPGSDTEAVSAGSSD